MVFIAIPLIYFYLSYFIPSIFSISVFSLAIFLFLGMVAIKQSSADCYFLIILLLFLLFSRGHEASDSQLSIEKDEVYSLYGRVISEPNGRQKRKKGFRVRLSAVGDSKGNIYSAKGSVYVISEDTDIHIFDFIHLEGKLYEDDLFLSSSSIPLSRGVFNNFRNRLHCLIRVRLRGGDSGELMQMLLLGSGERGDSIVIANATSSGLRHLLALSGMHLAVFDILLAPILRKTLKRRGDFILFTFLFFFTFLSGWRPSLVRAVLFRLFLYCSFGTGISFCFSAIALLLLFPWYGFDLGATYSFIALGGIILFSKTISNSLCFILPNNKFTLGIALSISAQILSIPISFSSFGSYQMVSIITSFPIGILISGYMILAIIHLFIPYIKPVVDIFYSFIEKAFEYSSLFPSSNTIVSYLVLVSIVLLVFSINGIGLIRRKCRVYK